MLRLRHCGSVSALAAQNSSINTYRACYLIILRADSGERCASACRGRVVGEVKWRKCEVEFDGFDFRESTSGPETRGLHQHGTRFAVATKRSSKICVIEPEEARNGYGGFLEKREVEWRRDGYLSRGAAVDLYNPPALPGLHFTFTTRGKPRSRDFLAQIQ